METLTLLSEILQMPADQLMIYQQPNHKLSLCVALLCTGLCSQAYDFKLGTNIPPVEFHGFASQGVLASTEYNYLADTKDGSLQFTEAGLNASMTPLPRLRISAQGFTYDVGPDVGEYDFLLDYAQAEYSFTDYLGVRAGRIRRPQGIYNHIQDVDLARTFVLLPQGVYDIRWRDFYCNMDGAEFFGNVSLNKAGSLSYEAYGGYARPRKNGGLGNYIRTTQGAGLTFDRVESIPLYGMQLWYNTPIVGLRAGYSILDAQNINYDLTAPAPIGLIQSKGKALIHQASLEYLWKSWTFQAEYFYDDYTSHSVTGFGPLGEDNKLQDAWYLSAAYRFNRWLEAGSYYTEACGDVHHRNDSRNYQKDLAIALRFDPFDSLIFKLEGHWIRGTGLLQNDLSNPGVSRDGRDWYLLALKTTFSF